MQNSDMVDYRATKATPRIQWALSLSRSTRYKIFHLVSDSPVRGSMISGWRANHDGSTARKLWRTWT
jgi:hypothetical protein